METLSIETLKDDPWNAVNLPLPKDASRELLTAAGKAVGLMYQNHENFEHLAASPADFQIRLLESAETIAAGLGLPSGYEITRGRGEFASHQQPETGLLVDFVDAGTRASGTAEPCPTRPRDRSGRDL